MSKDREFRSCEHTHFDHLLRSATLHHFITMEYITSNKGGRKQAFKNNIYIKWKVLSSGAVCWECNQRRTANTCKAKIHVLNDQVIRRVNEHTHNRNSDQPTISYADLSTDSFKKCLEFGWQGDIVYGI